MTADPRFRYRDPLDLPFCALGDIAIPGPPRVYVDPPGTLRFFRRNPPRFIDDPEGTGLFTELGSGVIVEPPTFVASAADARVTGFRTVLCREGYFFGDDAVWGRERDQLYKQMREDPGFEESGLRSCGEGSLEFDWDGSARAEEHIEGTVVLLSSTEPSNYGSFLFRILPKLQDLDRLRLKSPKYLVWMGVDVFRDYLELAGLQSPVADIVDFDPTKVYRVGHVIVPSLRNNQGYLDPASRAFFASLRQRYGTERKPGRRIYVSRMGQRHISGRTMHNEEALIQRLAGLDYMIVSPETLSAREQIAIFSSADLVVGPSGSGMFNTVFCHPGTRLIDIESEPHWIHAHISLFSSCDLEYGIFIGDADDHSFSAHHQPWTVNIEALVRRIQAFDESSPS